MLYFLVLFIDFGDVMVVLGLIDVYVYLMYLG